MTPTKTRHEIANLLDLLLSVDIALSTNEVEVEHIGRGTRRVTWVGSNSGSGELFRRPNTTIDEYCAWINRNAFSAVLFDGSLLQLTYDFYHDQLTGHRLVFFPCPFDMESEFLQELSLEQVIHMYRQSNDDCVQLRSPLRFDFDRNRASQDHPYSHLTFMWPHTRIPVSTPVTIGRFVEFVFRYFYPSVWHLHDFIRDWPAENASTTLVDSEFKGWHLFTPRG